MSPLLLVTALLLLLSSSPTSAQQSEGARLYDSLVARARTGDTTVDFGRMRMAYTETSSYNPYNFAQTFVERMMLDSLSADRHDAAISLARSLLDSNYVNLYAHFALTIALEQKGGKQESAVHRRILEELMSAIISTGDGERAETAWKVISVREEYFFALYFGVRVKGQSLVSADDGSPVDRMEFVDRESGEETVRYFNVAIPMSHMGKSLRK